MFVWVDLLLQTSVAVHAVFVCVCTCFVLLSYIEALGGIFYLGNHTAPVSRVVDSTTCVQDMASDVTRHVVGTRQDTTRYHRSVRAQRRTKKKTTIVGRRACTED